MLQKLVYKMVPDIYWQELERRGEFLKKRIVSPDEKALILDKVILYSCWKLKNSAMLRILLSVSLK